MAFSHNPLSLAIPPQDLQRWYSEQVVTRVQEAMPSRPGARERSRSVSALQTTAPASDKTLRSASLDLRSTDPLSELTPLQQLRWEQFQKIQWQEPRAWVSDFLGLEMLPRGYSMPDTWQQGRQRLRSNLEQYAGNYIRVFVFLLLSSFYKQPLALMGLYLLWRLSEELQRQAADMAYREPSWRWTATRWGLYAMMWFTAYFFRVILAAVMGVGISCVAIGVHGILREPLASRIQNPLPRGRR